jgi:hypothetical protein
LGVLLRDGPLVGERRSLPGVFDGGGPVVFGLAGLVGVVAGADLGLGLGLAVAAGLTPGVAEVPGVADRFETEDAPVLFDTLGDVTRFA